MTIRITIHNTQAYTNAGMPLEKVVVETWQIVDGQDPARLARDTLTPGEKRDFFIHSAQQIRILEEIETPTP